MKKNKKDRSQHRPVVGYEGLYQVTSTGKIWSVRSKRYISLDDNGYGYLLFIACKDGSRQVRLVHRVVAEAFLGPIGEGEEVNHLDRNPKNNNKNNLIIVTKKEHSLFHRGPNNGNYGKKKTREEIIRRTKTRKQRRLERMKNDK